MSKKRTKPEPQAPASEPPKVEIKKTEPFARAMTSSLSKVVCELAALRAETVARLEHAKPAKDRKPLLLTPLTRVEEGKLMEFATQAADLERDACLEIAGRFIAPEVLAQVKEAVYDERSPRAYTFVFDGDSKAKWFMAGFEPDELTPAK